MNLFIEEKQINRPGFDPWVWKIPGEGNSYPLQYSGLQSDSLPAELPGKQWCGEPCNGTYLQML